MSSKQDATLWRRFIRRVEQAVYGTGLWLFVGCVAVLGGGYSLIQNTRLQYGGIQTEARIVSITVTYVWAATNTPTGWRIEFDFTDKNGTVVQGSDEVDSSPLRDEIKEGKIRVGQNIWIVYLPGNPEVHRLRDNFDWIGHFIFASIGLGLLIYVGIRRRWFSRLIQRLH